MKVLDANLLLLAYDANAFLHERASKWLEEALSADEPVGLPILSIGAFVRISTDHRLPRNVLRMSDALEVVEIWLRLPHVTILHSSDRTWKLTKQCIVAGRVTGAMVTDAQLAALSMEHGATFYTHDSDFARFPGLSWSDPLVGSA